MNKLSFVLIFLGTILLCGSVALFCYNKWSEANSTADAQDLVYALEESAPVENQNTEQVKNIGGVDMIGKISIPKLGVTVPVTRTWDYEKLKTSACRYMGGVDDDRFIILAHNYSRFFGRIKNLGNGDDVVFYDSNGTEYHYQVDKVETIDKTEVDRLTDANYALSLFTCNYSGQKRVVARCNRK